MVNMEKPEAVAVKSTTMGYRFFELWITLLKLRLQIAANTRKGPGIVENTKTAGDFLT
jgi:hypothetical protein